MLNWKTTENPEIDGKKQYVNCKFFTLKAIKISFLFMKGHGIKLNSTEELHGSFNSTSYISITLLH
jgi:hypothetical protein